MAYLGALAIAAVIGTLVMFFCEIRIAHEHLFDRPSANPVYMSHKR